MPLFDIAAGESDARGSSVAPRAVTLDTNCLISLAKEEPAGASIDSLVLRHRAGFLRLRGVAASASERAPGGQSVAHYDGSQPFVPSLGLDPLPVPLPSGIYRVTNPDQRRNGDGA